MNPDNDIYLVAVGASAGGLEPLQSFFSALENPGRTAYVVIQHLSPDYKSMMGELLGRTTNMQIKVIEDGLKVEPDHVYLIPPAYNIYLTDATTFAAKRKESGVLNLPIDLFVSSAAGFYCEHMVAVILSGTGSDGARGIVEVNAQGGLALCQSPETAQFDGMPNSAMATGFIDDAGDPTYLAQVLVKHITHRDSHTLHDAKGKPRPENGAVQLSDILHELKVRTGIPFDEYKKSTVARRIERRMALRQVGSLADYLALLRKQPEELETLRRETLIGVTKFFRDAEAFEELGKVIADLVRNKRTGDSLRIWVAGCSTGEEAYSVAMIADECIRASDHSIELKVFATDMEQTYLDVAALGTYPESIRSEVSEQRLQRYFQRIGDQLRIQPELRKKVIFARHNMIVDAPFTRVDLVTCRNTLIYFETELQERVLRRFQYALGINGVLFLGSSESLGRLQRDFTVLSSPAKLFRTLRPAALSIEALQTQTHTGSSPAPARQQRRSSEATDPVSRSRQLLLEQLAPPSLLLSASREIVHIFGDVSGLLRVPRGQATLDPSRMLESTAATVLLSLLKESVEAGGERAVKSLPVKIGEEEDSNYYRLQLTPVSKAPHERGYQILSFHRVEISGAPTPGGGDDDDDERITVLQNELTLTRQNLQNTIEELEASNEELQATNEELLASNEELQSTNEELQSVNEELYTVNSEYQEKIRILDRVNTDLDTMAMATGIPTLFLDENIHIVRFTPTITDIYQLRESDVGRALSEFSNKIGYDNLSAEAAEVLRSQSSREIFWEIEGNRPVLIRIVPYNESGYGSQALVIMFIDITNLSRVDYMQSVLDSLQQQVAVIDENATVRVVNRAWHNMIAGLADGAGMGPGSNYLSICARQIPDSDLANAAVEGVRNVLSGELEHFRLEHPCLSRGEEHLLRMDVRKLHNATGAVISHIDTSELQAAAPAD